VTILALLALLLPGLAYWAWLGRRDQDPLITFSQIVGISVALICLLAQGVFLLGGHFSRASIWMLLAASFALTLLGLIKKGVKFPAKYHHAWIGFIVFGAVIAWRLFQARDLLLPNWVDSQHHYLIVRVILEKGGLPETLSPYLPVPFYYHFGFHAVAALFTALSGMEIGAAMLVLGQVLNAVIGLSIYTLGTALWKDWRPATAAALLASFATRMPAYYLSWGRYTLTSGLVLLPLAMAAALMLLKNKQRKSEIITLGILTAGVLLSHYFTAVLLALFLVLAALAYVIPRWHKPLSAVLELLPAAGGAVLGLLLAGPWLLRVLRYASASPGIELTGVETIQSIFENSRWEYISNLLGPASNYGLLAAAGIGLVWALIRLKAVPFALWSLSLGVMSLPLGVSFDPFRPDHFAIVLFLPIVLWVGWLVWRIGRWLSNKINRRWVSTAIFVVFVTGWAAWSLSLDVSIVNPVTVLVTYDDLDALQWVQENTPSEARFYINTTYWLNNVYRGVDGGGWLLPYTGRWALVPTVFYGYSPDKEVVLQTREWGERASQITTCSANFWSLVETAQLDWVYIREGTGSLQEAGLQGCTGIIKTYANDTVRIYTIQP